MPLDLLGRAHQQHSPYSRCHLPRNTSNQFWTAQNWDLREGFKKKAQTWDIVPSSATPSPPELGTSLSEITNTTK